MTRKLKVGAGAAAFLASFGIGTWVSSTALNLQGVDLWLYRGGLILLGLVATSAVAWFVLRRPSQPAPPSTDEGREIDTAIATAKARLASSRQAGSIKLHKLPVVLLLGPEGSTKTTTIVRSGLDPELLAGEVFRGDIVAPTRAVNLWYSQQTVFVEAGGQVTDDPARWMRLVRHLQPHRLRAALSRGAEAPRIAVVCFSCEEFLRPNSAESTPAAARMLRARLSDLALELGTNVPVYALFTKADRLPHFAEYVRNFSRDEAHDILGATLPLESRADSYAERAFKRIEGALQSSVSFPCLEAPQVSSSGESAGAGGECVRVPPGISESHSSRHRVPGRVMSPESTGGESRAAWLLLRWSPPGDRSGRCV